MFTTNNIIKFQKEFSVASNCLEYLSELKWKNGYSCRRCSCKTYTKGYTLFARRCKRCKYDESATAHTIFHNLKFNIVNAFYGVFRYCKKKGMSSCELGKEIGVSQKTAWLFHCKLQQAMISSGKYPLTGEVHVDEFVTGGPEEDKPGRSIGNKKVTLIMVEVRPDNKMGRMYCKQIDNYKKETLYPIIEATVDKDAAIVTDQYPSYDALKKIFPNATQVKSDKGKSFPTLHQQIMNFKGWLRGIHHHCSSKHYQKFLDEYSFRTNRRNIEEGMFKLLIGRSVAIKTKTYAGLTADAV